MTTTHQLASLLLSVPNVPVLVNDEPVKSPGLERIDYDPENTGKTRIAYILWTKAPEAADG